MTAFRSKARARRTTAIAACAISAVPAFSAWGAAPYRLFELQGLVVGDAPRPYAINNSGVIVGEADAPEGYPYYGNRQPMRWNFGQGSTTPERLELLGYRPFPGDFNGGSAVAVDAAGNAFGAATFFVDVNQSGSRPVRWAAGSTQATPLPPGDSITDVAPNGAVVGHTPADSGQGRRQVVWMPGAAAPTELARLTEDPNDYAHAISINSAGAVAGQARIGDEILAVVWDSPTAQPRALGHLQSPYKYSYAKVINDSGLVAGYSAKGPTPQTAVPWPVVWRPGSDEPQQMGVLHVRRRLQPGIGLIDEHGVDIQDMNNAGAIVGSGWAAPPHQSAIHAVIWDPRTFAPIDLNDWIDPASGWTLSSAHAINDKGQIVGTGGYDPDGDGPTPRRSGTFVLDPLPLTADANNDFRVDFRDFQILETNFGGPGDKAKGDFDADGFIDSADFDILRSEFGRWIPAVPTAAQTAPTIVPEPAAALLLAGAAICMTRRFSRKTS